MRGTAAGAARTMLGRAPRPWNPVVAWLRAADDPYLFYSASLVPIVVLVALIDERSGDFPTAIVLGGATLVAQAALGYLGRRRRLRSRLGWQLLRLLPPLLFVAVASRLIGGPSLPLLALYIPIVAAAAAAGTPEGAIAAGLAVLVGIAPELVGLGLTSELALRGVALASVTLV
ncbi:MAG: hypothetical protein H0U86_04825, partial [Chloroflexi bacterium]|nr:hypothetical protein [Chloroflexota bacterium]